MSDRKELIRRALMGDEQAQEECTEKGIMLPCPFCQGESRLEDIGWPHHVYCTKCGARSTSTKWGEDGEKESIKRWNTRPAPPIGRCGECKYGRKFSRNDSQNDFHWEETEIFMICKEPCICGKWEVKTLHAPDEYCNCFEPREE